MKRLLKTSLLALLLLGCGGSGSKAEKQTKAIDHTYASYGRVLADYVSEGHVDYRKLLKNRSRLDSLIDDLALADLSALTPDQELAFYINAYNIITLRSIIDHYPMKSIKDIDGVWDKSKWTVGGSKLTLNKIEHGILRKDFAEPRIHFAVVCASIGCPPLAAQPYLPESMDAQLSEAARAFATSTEYNRLDPDQGIAELSSIFDWFGEDFIVGNYSEKTFAGLSNKENAVLSFLIRQFPEEDRARLLTTEYKISYTDYDWSLNDINLDK